MPKEREQPTFGPDDTRIRERGSRRSLVSYVISLPERMVRTVAAGSGGLLLETADHILPPVARGSKFYQCTVARPFRITVEFVGGVEGRFPSEMSAPELVKRKVAGNVVELGCVFTVGFSPLWFLAAASDVTNGTRVYLDTFVRELKRVDVLPESTDISTVNDLLTLLEGASSQAADAIDIPPVAIADMRDAVDLLREHAELIPEPQRLADVFAQLSEVAREQKHSILVCLHAGGCRRGRGRHTNGQRPCIVVLHGRPEKHTIGGGIPISRAHKPALHRRRRPSPRPHQPGTHAKADSRVSRPTSLLRARNELLAAYEIRGKNEPPTKGWQKSGNLKWVMLTHC